MDWDALFRNAALEMVRSIPSLVVTIWPLLLLLALIQLAKFAFRTFERRRLAKSGIAEIDRMDGLDFERYLETLFVRLGHSVERTRYVGDFGGDLVTRKNGVKTVVQAKRHNRSVGVKAIQEAVAAKGYYDCTVAMVVTTALFTKQAVALAKSNGVVLWDRARLIEAVLSVRTAQPEALATAEPQLPAAIEPVTTHTVLAESPGSALACATCGKTVTEKVRDYCQLHHDRFGGQVYCYDHQRAPRRIVSSPSPSEPSQGQVGPRGGGAEERHRQLIGRSTDTGER